MERHTPTFHAELVARNSGWNNLENNLLELGALFQKFDIHYHLLL